VAAYVIFVAIVAVVYAAAIPAWPYILVAHCLLVVFILVLPPRGAAWEPARSHTFSGASSQQLRLTYRR
jgi:hypothetical protein